MLLLGVYGGALSQLLGGKSWIYALPPFSSPFIELMAISHAGYLAYKAIPKPGQGGAGDPTPGLVGAGASTAGGAAPGPLFATPAPVPGFGPLP